MTIVQYYSQRCSVQFFYSSGVILYKHENTRLTVYVNSECFSKKSVVFLSVIVLYLFRKIFQYYYISQRRGSQKAFFVFSAPFSLINLCLYSIPKSNFTFLPSASESIFGSLFMLQYALLLLHCKPDCKLTFNLFNI
jgi:hypothetical protein